MLHHYGITKEITFFWTEEGIEAPCCFSDADRKKLGVGIYKNGKYNRLKRHNYDIFLDNNEGRGLRAVFPMRLSKHKQMKLGLRYLESESESSGSESESESETSGKRPAKRKLAKKKPAKKPCLSQRA